MKQTGILDWIPDSCGISVDNEELIINSLGGSYKLRIYTDTGWSIRNIPEFITINQIRGIRDTAITINVEQYDDPIEDRIAEFSIINSLGNEVTVRIIQQAPIIEYTYHLEIPTWESVFSEHGASNVFTVTSYKIPYVNGIQHGDCITVLYKSTSNVDWAKVVQNQITVSENETEETKCGQVTIRQYESGITKVLDFSQNSSVITWKFDLDVSDRTIAFAATPSDKTVNVICNRTKYLNHREIDEKVSANWHTTKSDWLNLIKESDTFVVSASNNTSTSIRDGIVIISVNSEGFKTEGSIPESIEIAVSQNAGSKIYENLRITSFQYDVRDALGGTLTPIINSSIDWTWNGYGPSSTINYTYSDLNENNIDANLVTAIDGCSVNKDTAIITWNKNASSSERSAEVNLNLTLWSLTVFARSTVIQLSDGIDHYGDIEIFSFTVDDIPASGGEINSGVVSYKQIVYYTSGKESEITSGAKISYSTPISASSLGTTDKDRTKIGELTVTVSLNDKIALESVDVYQAENKPVYEDVIIEYFTVDDIPASGGSVSDGEYDIHQRVSYPSTNSSRAGLITISYSEPISGSDKGVTISNRTKLGTLTLYALGEGSKSSSQSVDVYQSANRIITFIPKCTIAYTGTVNASGSNALIPSITDSSLVIYNSGAEEGIVNGKNGGSWHILDSWSMDQNWATITSDGQVSCENRGSDIGLIRSANVEFARSYTFVYDSSYSDYNPISGSQNIITVPISQDANVVIEINVIESSLSYKHVPASGGESNPTTVDPEIIFEFSSGETSSNIPLEIYGTFTSNTIYTISPINGADINNNTGVVTWESRGAVPGEYREVSINKITSVDWTPSNEYAIFKSINTNDQIIATCRQSANTGAYRSGVITLKPNDNRDTITINVTQNGISVQNGITLRLDHEQSCTGEMYFDDSTQELQFDPYDGIPDIWIYDNGDMLNCAYIAIYYEGMSPMLVDVMNSSSINVNYEIPEDGNYIVLIPDDSSTFVDEYQAMGIPFEIMIFTEEGDQIPIYIVF